MTFASAGVLCLAACGGGGVSGGATGVVATTPPATVPDQSALPSVGQRWIYQQKILAATDPTYNGQNGTLTIAFNGPAQSYRGATYYSIDAQSSIARGPIPTAFFQQSAGGFSEIADAYYNFPIVAGCENKSPQIELVLDAPVGLASADAASVGETYYSCGQQPARSQAVVALTDGGASTLNTPAGLYAVRVISGDFTDTSARAHLTNYVFGKTIIGRDTTMYDPRGTVSWQAQIRYVSGPLDVAFPGPPELLSQWY